MLRPLLATASFVGFGLGWDSFGVEDATEREAGLSGYFKIGYALRSCPNRS